jgi:hypothetical protein
VHHLKSRSAVTINSSSEFSTSSLVLPLLAVLLPPLSTHSALFGASSGGTGGRGQATIGSRTRANQRESSPDSLLTRGMSGCYVKQLLGAF